MIIIFLFYLLLIFVGYLRVMKNKNFDNLKKILIYLIVSCLSTEYSFAQSWNFQQKTVSYKKRTANDSYGQAVAIQGEYAMVGAWVNGYDSNGDNYLAGAGAVYLYQKSASGIWTSIKKIVPSDRTLFDAFGFAVAMDSNYAVIGAPFEGLGAVESAGAVYVFENKDGDITEVNKLFAPDREYLDEFGTKVAISGDWIIVGSNRDGEDENGENTMLGAGSAYLYHRNAGDWVFAQKIVASDRSGGSNFGYSVAIDGDFAAIGALGGSTYIFKNVGGLWNEVQQLRSIEEAAFGRGLSMKGNMLIAGAGGHNSNGNKYTGSAFIFENIGGIWTRTQRLEASDGRENDFFGYSIDFEGDYIVGGALGNSYDANNQNYCNSTGAAYIYQKSVEGVWTEIQKIVAPDRDPDIFEDFPQQFGISVGISGGYILCGANLESFIENGENYIYESGAAYFFQNSVLPLGFSALTGEKKDNKNILYWQTFIETNLQNMQVQRSIDGVNFQPIATVAANKNASTYSYEDATAVAGVTNFYRINFTEQDGRKELSNTISIAATAIPFTISIRPNPFTTTFSIVANTGLTASTTMTVHWYNTAGRKVYTEIRFLNSGDNTITLNTAALPKGIYMVEFMLSDGRRKVEKVVKE